jgi:hypothetical protein
LYQSDLFMVGHTQKKLDYLLGNGKIVGGQKEVLKLCATRSSGFYYNNADFQRGKILS